MSHSTNITRIKAVNNALADLKDKVVFVGGTTVSLYPDRRFFEARVTDDVDVIVEIINYQGRAELEEKLRSLGFAHDIESSIVCRYKIEGIVVDIMPTDDPSIGFNTKWYPEGFQQAIDYAIDADNTVKILTAPYFIATKLEAFNDRGKGDGRTSHDFEDIVFVLENRSTIWEELNEVEGEVKEYLLNEFTKLANNPNLFEWLDGHVERGSPPASYIIENAIKKFTKATP
jgi:predicted nucleotidyltransferase